MIGQFIRRVTGQGGTLTLDDPTGWFGQGINSMTTTDGKTRTEDMQFIETVEAMDMMRDDITSTFRSTYLGNYRNSRDNQMAFIGALNASYDCCPALQEPELHAALGVTDPYDTIWKLMEPYEIDQLGGKLYKWLGLIGEKAEARTEEAAKNS